MSTIDEWMEYVDEAGKRFYADAKPIQADYLEKREQLVAARDAALAESERIKREALETFDAAQDEAKKNYIDAVRKAAQKRAKESEHPDHITEACDSFLRPTERNTGGGTLDPIEIIKIIGMSEKGRIEYEAYCQRAGLRIKRVRGLVPLPRRVVG